MSHLVLETVTLMGVKERGRLPVAANPKARHLYVVLDTVEAGIVLVGNEVKSLRLRRASLAKGSPPSTITICGCTTSTSPRRTMY